MPGPGSTKAQDLQQVWAWDVWATADVQSGWSREGRGECRRWWSERKWGPDHIGPQREGLGHLLSVRWGHGKILSRELTSSDLKCKSDPSGHCAMKRLKEIRDRNSDTS